MSLDPFAPELERLTALAPAHIEEIRERPDLMQQVARAMGAINLSNLFELMQLPDVPIAHKLKFQELLNKMGGFDTVSSPATSQGSGFSVIINIPPTPTLVSGAVIEAKAAPVSLPEQQLELADG